MYPTKSRPAVPSRFRTILNVFIMLPSKPIWRVSSMPWLPKSFSSVDYELEGRHPNGYAAIAWAIVGKHDRAWSDRPVFGRIRYMSFTSTSRKSGSKKYIEQITSLEKRGFSTT
jgi:hypothetical protein